MTSFAFIFGVLPLAISTGAGANSRIAIGTSVIGGMLTATVLAIFYIPLFFVLVRRGVRDGLQLCSRPYPAAAAGGDGMRQAGAADRAGCWPAASRSSRTMYGRIQRCPPSWPVGDPYLRQAKQRFRRSPTGTSSATRGCNR